MSHPLAFSALTAAALLSGTAMAQGIYTCTDAKGRKITSDRPIAECMDRAQNELSSQGTVKRVIAPSLTSAERAAQDEKDKAEGANRQLAAEEKKRDRALMQRYPSRQAHDAERSQALAVVDENIKASTKRAQELVEQRKSIGAEMEFYKKDPGRAPASLRRRIDENESSVAAQKRAITEQEAEKQRINRRFDEELVKLRPAWDAIGVSSGPATGRASAKN